MRVGVGSRSGARMGSHIRDLVLENKLGIEV